MIRAQEPYSPNLINALYTVLKYHTAHINVYNYHMLI